MVAKSKGSLKRVWDESPSSLPPSTHLLRALRCQVSPSTLFSFSPVASLQKPLSGLTFGLASTAIIFLCFLSVAGFQMILGKQSMGWGGRKCRFLHFQSEFPKGLEGGFFSMQQELVVLCRVFAPGIKSEYLLHVLSVEERDNQNPLVQVQYSDALKKFSWGILHLVNCIIGEQN